MFNRHIRATVSLAEFPRLALRERRELERHEAVMGDSLAFLRASESIWIDQCQQALHSLQLLRTPVGALLDLVERTPALIPALHLERADLRIHLTLYDEQLRAVLSELDSLAQACLAAEQPCTPLPPQTAELLRTLHAHLQQVLRSIDTLRDRVQFHLAYGEPAPAL